MYLPNCILAQLALLATNLRTYACLPVATIQI